MARSLSFNVLASALLGILCVGSLPSEAVKSAPRRTFPGRRVGGGTRGECAARLIVHLVPPSSVFAPGETAVIGWLEGPSSAPQAIDVSLRAAAADGSTDAGTAALVQKQMPAAANRLALLSIPGPPRPLLWESSYPCDADDGADGLASSPHLRHRPSVCWFSRWPEDKSCSSNWPASRRPAVRPRRWPRSRQLCRSAMTSLMPPGRSASLWRAFELNPPQAVPGDL